MSRRGLLPGSDEFGRRAFSCVVAWHMAVCTSCRCITTIVFDWKRRNQKPDRLCPACYQRRNPPRRPRVERRQVVIPEQFR